MRALATVLLILVLADAMAGEEPFLLKLQQEGLTMTVRQELETWGVPRLEKLARAYLPVEADPTRFQTFLQFMETAPHGPDILRRLYPALLLDIGIPRIRGLIYGSLVRVQPEKGRTFLLGELEDTESVLTDNVLNLLRHYPDAVTQAAVLPYVEDPIHAEIAVRTLGRIGMRESIPVLIRQVGRASNPGLRAAAAAALEEITGYEFGMNYKVWSHWWQTYGDRFVRKRFLPDYRRIHPVKDYTFIETEFLDYFLQGIALADPTDLKSILDADEHINHIVNNPARWRAVLFQVRGEVKSIEAVLEKDCAIVSVTSPSYPSYRIIVAGTLPAKGEYCEFQAVFYQLRGDKNVPQPDILFVGRLKGVRPREDRLIAGLIDKFRSADSEIRDDARRKITVHGDKAVPALIDAIQYNKDVLVRSTALLVLADISPDRALPYLEDALLASDPLLRNCAEVALDKILEDRKQAEREERVKPVPLE